LVSPRSISFSSDDGTGRPPLIKRERIGGTGLAVCIDMTSSLSSE